QLVTLKDDLPIDFELEDAQSRCEKLPVEELLATFRELGFNRFQDELKALVQGGGGTTTEIAAPVTDSARAKPQAAAGFTDGCFSTMEQKPGPYAAAGGHRCSRRVVELEERVR